MTPPMSNEEPRKGETTVTESTPELRPCPFCGCEALHQHGSLYCNTMGCFSHWSDSPGRASEELWNSAYCWEEIDRLKKSNAALVDAVRDQHDAIDTLFAMLIVKDKNFRPSKSGKPWEAIVKGNIALEQAKDLQ